MKESKNSSPLSALVLVSRLGLTIVLPTLLGAWGGHRLDIGYNTGVRYLITGILFGLAAGAWGAYRQITREIALEPEQSATDKKNNQK